jgi:hypothetical protein
MLASHASDVSSVRAWVCHFNSGKEYNGGMVASPAVFQQRIFMTCINQLMQRWKNCVDNDGDSMEK